MEHGGIENLPEIKRGLVSLSRETGIPLVATNDSHYVSREDALSRTYSFAYTRIPTCRTNGD